MYGLKDGPADMWDEDTICYNNAPGLLEAKLGDLALDNEQIVKLGTFGVINNRVMVPPIPIDSQSENMWSPPSTLFMSKGHIFNRSGSTDERGKFVPARSYSSKLKQSIYVHANAGVTFDLDAVRAENGQVTIESFNAACGVCGLSSSVSFYVLIDGTGSFQRCRCFCCRQVH